MFETSENKDTTQLGAQHAQIVRDEVEQIVDKVQEVATNVGDYVTSFVATLFQRS